MKNSVLLPFAMCVGVFLLFTKVISVEFYNIASIIIPLIGGGIFAIPFYYFLKNLRRNNKDFYPIVQALLVGFGVGIYFMYIATELTIELLQKEGIITKAEVIDGSGMKVRSNGAYDIVVQFQNEIGKTLTKEISVGEDSFDRLFLGQEISIIYYPKDPSIIEAILTKEDEKNYLNIVDKDLKVNFSLLAVLSRYNQTQLQEYFNGYSQWNYQGEATYGKHWTNSNSDEHFYKSKNRILYTAQDITTPTPFKKELTTLGFKLVPEEGKSPLTNTSQGLISNFVYKKDNSEVVIQQYLDMTTGLTTIVSFTF